jgi:hypothetical protein
MIQFEALDECVPTSIGIASSIVSAKGEVGETMLYEVLSSHLPHKEGVLVCGGETLARMFKEYIDNRFAGGSQLFLCTVIHHPGYDSIYISAIRDVRQIHEIDDAQGPVRLFASKAYNPLAQTSSVRSLPFNQNAYCCHAAYCIINVADFVK